MNDTADGQGGDPQAGDDEDSGNVEEDGRITTPEGPRDEPANTTKACKFHSDVPIDSRQEVLATQGLRKVKSRNDKGKRRRVNLFDLYSWYELVNAATDTSSSPDR